MYQCFVENFPETKSLPFFIVSPFEVKNCGYNSDNFFVSTHPHLSDLSFIACDRLIDFVKIQKPENVIVLLSGGSSALIEKSNDKKECMALNEKLLKSGLPITEINRIRSEVSLVKNGKFAELFENINWYVFVMSDIPYYGGEKNVGSMPFFREDLNNTELIKCADSDSLHNQLLRKLPKNTVSVRNFVGQVEELKNLIVNQIESGTESLLVTGEPLLKVNAEKSGAGGRMSHLALLLLPFLKEKMRLLALSSDGIDGNSPFAGAIVEGCRHSFDKKEIELYLKEYNSAILLDKFGFMLKTGYTGVNLNDFVIFLKEQNRG